ncbi:MAG: hypothetical protein ABW061_01305 [Polyangiaceae bacterium]
MTRNDDDSIFEQALRGDLPSVDEQARLRKRLFAAGLSAGTGLAATSTASAQAGWGATVFAKVAALSWPATLALGAAVATPIVALPIWLSPNKTSHAPTEPARSVRVAASAAPSAERAHASSAAEGAVAGSAVAGSAVASSAVASSAVAESGTRSVPRTAGSGVVSALHTQRPSAAAVSAAPAVAAFAVPSSADGDASVRGASTLAAETQLLDRAFAELAAGNRSAASALIAEHARRFPNGLLNQERERARARLEQNSEGE